MEALTPRASQVESQRPWRLPWLTPVRCRLILAAVLCFGFLSHLRYLTNNCPLDLAGDEAYYWDWSRKLDLSYYSKGPLVALIMRASCSIFGDVMPAVRLPALLLAVGTSLATYWLTRRLFASEKLALGSVLLTHLVPIFVAGSILLTIDPPYYFCWALATCFAVKAVFDGSRWAWIAIGAAIGVGFLAKYTALAWFVGLLLFLLFDRDSRRHLRSPWPWISLAVALLFTTPVLVWNIQHRWVTALHVGTHGHLETSHMNVLEFFGGQVATLGPPLAIIMVGAIIWGLRRDRAPRPWRRPVRFLLWMGLPFYAMVGVMSVWTKVQANWPAAAYFTLMVLTAAFLGSRLANPLRWHRWRGWVWAAVGFAIVAVPLAHNTELIYPLIERIGRRYALKPERNWLRQKWDPTHRLRGWRDVAEYISSQLRQMPPGSFVMCERYEATAALAFYIEEQPKTYYVGSWFQNPERRGHYSQYDLWPDRQLDRPELIGKDAVFLGYEPPRDLRAAFDHMEALPGLDIRRAGMKIDTLWLWHGYGFKGMHRPADPGKF